MQQTTMSYANVRHDPRFLLWLALITLLAAAVREHFVLVTIVDVPIRGDIKEYVFYAWNLIHHGVFSLVPPQVAVPAPDAYRSPGFPWLIALCMALRPHGDWYALALQAQVLLSTSTVTLCVLLGRKWLPQWAALVAGGLLALWPHHIAATGTLLSEVFFGFTLMASLYLFAREKFPAAGAMFGFSYLVNPLVGLFPIGLVLVLVMLPRHRIDRRKYALFLGVFLIPMVALAVRNTAVDSDTTGRQGRLAVNFVQGSWPLYHRAWNAFRGGNPIPVAIMQSIDDEINVLSTDPAAGLAMVGKRLRKQPGYFATWYMWDKPWLLWDWDIRIGYGGPYFLEMRNSPLERQPVLHAITRAYRAINPVLTLLAGVGALLILVGTVRRRSSIPATATALLALYLTALHVVLQSEPRYANAYRGIEALLVVTTCAWLLARYQRYRRTKTPL